MPAIRNAILTRLPPYSAVSAHSDPEVVNLIVKVNWNPLDFLLAQEYSDTPAAALETVITLTGTPKHAQALPCLQYLDQTWPSSGRHVLALLQNLMLVGLDQQAQGMMSVA